MMDDHAQIHESTLTLAERELMQAQYRLEAANLRLSFERRIDAHQKKSDNELKEAGRFPWLTVSGAFGAGVSFGAWFVNAIQHGLHP